jgi:hypothetical protein
MVVPLIARGVTLGVAGFARAEHPEPYDEADVRLVSDLSWVIRQPPISCGPCTTSPAAGSG